jgi:hypothetical protein
VTRTADGGVLLAGAAHPGAVVRLASPAGAEIRVRADGAGRWQARLQRDPGAVRLFGLSAREGIRVVQAEGYLAIADGGDAAQLRAGAGAARVAPGGGLEIGAVDFDRRGGTVISGQTRPGLSVEVRVDGQARGAVRADNAGRFTLALDEPLKPGPHEIAAASGGETVKATATMTPGAPLVGVAFRAEHEAEGWRIDWLTPGGGVQTTLLVTAGGAA